MNPTPQTFTIAIAIVAIIILVCLIIIVLMQRTHSSTMLESIKERRLYSNISEDRRELESRISTLEKKLVNSTDRFQEINHLVLSGQGEHSEQEPVLADLSKFFSDMRIDKQKIKLERNLVFVLTPFADSELNIFATVVKAFANFGIRVLRGDEEYHSGEILPHIVECILKARLIVANVEGRNPNVMYELGIAHALGKEVILISGAKNKEEDLPFDIDKKRVIFYRSYGDLIRKLQENIMSRYFGELMLANEKLTADRN